MIAAKPQSFHKETGNLYWVDHIRVCAIFMVVLLHTAAPPLYEYGRISVSTWWAANIIDSAVRMCVPLFFMLTGYLLLGKQESLSKYFEKRFFRIFNPLLAWSFIYLLWLLFYKHATLTPLMVLNRFTSSGMYFHFWFLYALIGLYLIIPILRILVGNARKIDQLYYVGLWFIAASLMPQLKNLCLSFLERDITTRIDLKMMTGFSGYLLLGYILGQLEFSKRKALIALPAYIASVAVTALGTFYITKHNGAFVKDFYAYLSVNVLIMSIAAFVLLKYLGESCEHNNNVIKLVTTLSPLTLGIYFIHPMILEVLESTHLLFSMKSIYPNALHTAPINAALIFFISSLVIFVFSKIPLLRKIV